MEICSCGGMLRSYLVKEGKKYICDDCGKTWIDEGCRGLSRSGEKMKTFEFTYVLIGKGETEEKALDDALENFMQCIGEPTKTEEIGE